MEILQSENVACSFLKTTINENFQKEASETMCWWNKKRIEA